MVWELAVFIFQLPRDLRLCNAFSYKKVADYVLDQRHEECGSRALKLKDLFVISKQCGLDWNRGSYTRVWDSSFSRVVQIEHVSGDRVPVPEGIVWGVEWTMHENFDDWEAQLLLGDGILPASVKLCTLFEDTISGPYRVTRIESRSSIFERRSNAAYEALSCRMPGKYREAHVPLSSVPAERQRFLHRRGLGHGACFTA